MRKPAILAAAAGAMLAGCAAYDAPVTEGGAYYSDYPPYYGPYYSYNRGPYYAAPAYTYSYPYYRDRDGDGTPDVYDRRPNNPYRR